jgi:molecular chaperone GrpE (heat shock protein)
MSFLNTLKPHGHPSFDIVFRSALLVSLLSPPALGALQLPQLDLGSEEAPHQPADSLPAARERDGSYRFAIVAGRLRLVRFKGIAPDAKMRVCCDGQPQRQIPSGMWFEISGKCIIEASPADTRPELTLEVASETSADLADMSKDYPGWKDFESRRPYQVRVLSGSRPPWELIILAGLAFLLLAAAVGWLLLRGRVACHERMEREPTESPSWYRFQPTSRTARPTTTGGRLSDRTEPPRADAISATAKEEIRELRDSIQWQEQALKLLESNQRNMRTDVERMLGRFLQAVEQEFASSLKEAIRVVRELQHGFHGQVSELHDRLQRLELQLQQVQDYKRKGLRELLEVIPHTILDSPGGTGAPDGSTLATQLEQALARYFSSSSPSRDSMQRFLERTDRLQHAVMRFRQVASGAGHDAENQLHPVSEEIARMHQELADLINSAKEQRLRLTCTIDFATHEASRQDLAEAIAAGLEREIVKLNDLEEYYEKQFILMAARAAAECADLADSRLDPERSRSEIQNALRQVFQAGDIIEIAPQKNEEFRAVEHMMLQLVRRSSPSDRSGAVASLLGRGLKHGGHVIRKATVLVFD